jgi:hypothetical protein
MTWRGSTSYEGNIQVAYMLRRSRVSSGSIVSDYELDDRAIRGSIPGKGKGIFLYPLCPDRL